MKLFLGRLLLRASASLPTGGRRRLAGTLERLVRLSGWRKLDVVRDNLKRAFPGMDPARLERTARANTRAMLETFLECGPAWTRDRRWFERRIAAVHGREHVGSPLAGGRGVLVLGGHLGNWELSILYGSLTLPIAYLYKPPRSPKVERVLTGYRARFGAEMIPTGGAAMRRALKRLRAGRAVGMLFDQLPRGGDSVRAAFFGHPVATMTLPHRLVRATGCAVVMGHCLRTSEGAWEIRFDPVPGADDPDPVRAATAMNRVLEEVVRSAPEQYLWQYRRFDPLMPAANVRKAGHVEHEGMHEEHEESQ